MAQAKIVVIEDDIDNLDILCCELFDTYELHPISDEQFTIANFEKIQPDLIILDTEMQNVDIFAVYRLLKNHPRLKAIPILFVTGADNIAHKDKLASLNTEKYIYKPFNTLKLKTTIRRLLP